MVLVATVILWFIPYWSPVTCGNPSWNHIDQRLCGGEREEGSWASRPPLPLSPDSLTPTLGGGWMPKCSYVGCGDPWKLVLEAEYECQLSDKSVKWYRCGVCGTVVETIDGFTTPDGVLYLSVDENNQQVETEDDKENEVNTARW